MRKFIRPLACLAALLASCSKEARQFRAGPATGRAPAIAQSELFPGLTAPPASGPNPYEGNAHALAEGRRLYRWFNCNGCHFNGGGGIGPPLMDDQWIYGSEPANVFATIVQGRPNGMPSFHQRLNDQQVWQIVAYVRSLGKLPDAGKPPQRASEKSAARDVKSDPE